MAKHPMQPVEYDAHGVIRFKRNKIVDYLLERARAIGCDMNHLASMHNLFENEDYEQFAQLIGYSVSGFGDLSYADPRTVRTADARARKLREMKRR